MKPILLSCMLSVTLALGAAGQAVKSSIMVFPNDQYMTSRGFMVEFKDPIAGVTQSVPDYNKALQNDPELLLVIAKINGIFAQRGFPIEDLKETIDEIRRSRTEEAVVLAGAGKSVEKSPYDEVTEFARPDIAMYVTWNVAGTGPKKVLTFILEAKDSYTRKTVSSKSGTSEPTLSGNTPAMLEEAVLKHIDNLIAELQTNRENQELNGREVVLRMKLAEGVGFDFESDCSGKELAEVIEGWLAKNCKGGRYKKNKGTETRLEYTNVMIEMTKDGQGYTAEAFGKELAQYIKATCADKAAGLKRVPRGLGGMDLIFGGKK